MRPASELGQARAHDLPICAGIASAPLPPSMSVRQHAINSGISSGPTHASMPGALER